MDLEFSGGFGKAQGVADLLLVAGAGGPVLVAVERIGGGLRSYDVHSLAEQDYRPHQGAHLGTGAAAQLGGSSGRVLLAGSQSSRLDSHLVDIAGQIGAKDSWTLPGLAQGAEVTSLTSATSAGSALVYGVAEGALRGWQVSASGTATAVARSGAGSAYDQMQITALEVVTTGTSQILVVADAALGGLRSYRISAGTGALTEGAQLGAQQGLGIAAPTAVQGLSAYGQSWAVLAAAGTSSLSVVQVAPNGDLRLMDHVIDSLGSRFGAVTAIECFVLDGHAFVLAAGGDGGMELMRLLPTGQLVQAAQMVHASGQGLQNVTAIETHITAGEVSIFVASEGGLNADGEGIAQYVLDRGSLGQVIEATGSTLTGTAGDDLLMGRGQATTLSGGAGDDMLVATAAGDRLDGGAGADRFVILPGLVGVERDRVVITGFEPGRDQLDLSLLTGLRSLSQLEVEQRHNGIDLHWQGLDIRVESRDGSRLTLSDLWPLGWAQAHHLPIGETLPASTLTGSSGSDSLLGSDSSETVQGGGGNDTIDGQAGDDLIEGGDGGDVLLGGFGNDSLIGGAGDDRLEGGADQDLLEGGDGDDHLEGGLGQDSLYGHDGADHLRGDAENDSLWGGAGADRLEGGTGADYLAGNAGADRIYGGDGADLILGHRDADALFGGQGADSIEGHGGADSVWGDDGQDTLRGGFGQDRIWGGNGPDRLFGNQGADDLNGNKGADRLHGGGGPDDLHGHQGPDRAWGGGGRDTIYGGAGQDTLYGGRGPDQIEGQWGRDILHGEQGNDRLNGGGGADVLWGGEGADVFVFSGRHGRDRIMDFTAERDRIDLSALDATAAQNFSDLQITRQEEDLLIHTGVGQITLEGLAELVLDPADFIF